MKKHAYLIIAHDKYEQLQVLLRLLDDPRNDIYIHIDKKSPPLNLGSSDIANSAIYIIPDKDRIDVRWGDVSQIECELLLYKTAYSTYHYAYYHLLSGYDLPIKTQDYIHSFFDAHSGKNFIGIGDGNYISKVARKHYLTKLYRVRGVRGILIRLLRYVLERTLNAIRPLKRSTIVYKKGANWASLTDDFVGYMVSKSKTLLKHYKRSCCGDEIYKQTLIWNSHYKASVYNSFNEFDGCMRLIDWQRGTPYTFMESDIEYIKNSKYLFARKFDITKSPSVVNMITYMLRKHY